MPTKPEKSPPSLVEFVRAKRRVGCKVCALPEALRGQLAESARTKKIPLADQIEWLAAAHHIVITRDDFLRHYSQRLSQPGDCGSRTPAVQLIQ